MSDAMRTTARELVAPGKGILAADESTGTIQKRFDSIGVESTEETRRRTARCSSRRPALGDHISGVILFDETIRQATDDGVAVRRRCSRRPARSPASRSTPARSRSRVPRRDRHRGPRRAPRAARRVPRARRPLREVARADRRRRRAADDYAIHANVHAMARYAALCQEAGHRPDR